VLLLPLPAKHPIHSHQRWQVWMDSYSSMCFFTPEILLTDDWTFCEACQKKRPPKAHHCRRCGQCVPLMDHHCPWYVCSALLLTQSFLILMHVWWIVSDV
jgi:predicted amidophosphoribosyltransferase